MLPWKSGSSFGNHVPIAIELVTSVIVRAFSYYREAVGRWVIGGEVGIHRPYSTYVGNRDYESTRNEYRRTEAAVRAYLAEMNLPGQLFEAMLRVPPEKIRILSDEETEAFGLSGTDPVEQETRDAMDASWYGISKSELLRRKANVDKVCPLPLPGPDFTQRMNAYNDCTNAYMVGSIRTHL